MRHLLLYDGVCGLCNRLNRFVLERDGEGQFGFTPLQSRLAQEALGRYGKNSRGLDNIYLLADYQTDAERLLSKARAALFVLREMGWPWRLGTILSVLPTFLLNLGYDLIARRRYRIFGKYEACPRPTSDHAHRFVGMETVETEPSAERKTGAGR
ncbi:MAG: thiol-disulfide oxidoreductase DCC family protein [Acidobacteriota bacterium]